jgi:hypothetical protein
MGYLFPLLSRRCYERRYLKVTLFYYKIQRKMSYLITQITTKTTRIIKMAPRIEPTTAPAISEPLLSDSAKKAIKKKNQSI